VRDECKSGVYFFGRHHGKLNKSQTRLADFLIASGSYLGIESLRRSFNERLGDNDLGVGSNHSRWKSSSYVRFLILSKEGLRAKVRASEARLLLHANSTNTE
jgi:hypothetical protein